jgi:hypothetical protein
VQRDTVGDIMSKSASKPASKALSWYGHDSKHHNEHEVECGSKHDDE